MSMNVKEAESFEFSPENLEWTKTQFAKYPENRKESCVMPFESPIWPILISIGPPATFTTKLPVAGS